MHDLIIRGATVYDGLGNPGKVADVAVDKGRVTAIGKVSEGGRETVDAGGLCLMPGIVDLHTHYDAQVTWDPTMSPSPALGVTTAVIGNCGFGIAPCPAPVRETMMKNLSVVEGMDLKALLSGTRWEFETFPEYMDLLRKVGPYLNTAVFAGHSVLRTAVMGDAGSEKAVPSDAELTEMQRQLREALDAGAIGFASSFSPNHSGYGGRPMPSTIATEAELRALSGVMGETGRGVFMMATGTRATPQVMEGITAANGRPSYLSTVLTMYNEAAPERGLTYYEECSRAQARGHEVYVLTSCQPLAFDFTLTDPYVLLSHSAFERVKSATREDLPGIYGDPGFRNQFRADLKNPKSGILFLGNWERIELSVAATPAFAEFEGKSIAAIARQMGVDPVDAFCDIALKENLGTHFLGKFFQNDDNGVAPLLKHPAGVVTLSDAGAHLIYMCDAGFGPHFLSHWVRETGHFSLQEGIRKLTSHPAHAFRIPDRGRLVEGAPADLLLFDPATIGISKPRQQRDLPGGGSRMVRDASGVHGVWVNGTKIHDGKNYVKMDRGPGQVLDRFYA